MAASRSAAASLVTTGAVTVRGIPTPKPGAMVTSDTPIEFVGERPRYVGRGGLKLEGALAEFDLDVTGRNALERANKTIRGITGVEVVKENAAVEDGKIIEFRATVMVTFVLEK